MEASVWSTSPKSPPPPPPLLVPAPRLLLVDPNPSLPSALLVEVEDAVLVVFVMALDVAVRLVAAEKELVVDALAVLETDEPPLEEEELSDEELELLELEELFPAVEATCVGTSLDEESLLPDRPNPLRLPLSWGEISETKFSAAVTPVNRSVRSIGPDRTGAVRMITARTAAAASSAARR